MSRYLAYDPALLVDLRAAIDAAVWHIAATRFEHPYCEEWRGSVLAIRPRLEELRDTLLQPVIDSDAMAAAAFWNTLSDGEQRELIDERPDLAVNALVGGATFTSDELEQLESSNAYATFSEEFGVEIAAQVNLRWATIAIAGGYSVLAMKMSDGTVQVAIVKDSEIGAGVEADGGDGTSASLTAGAFISSETVFLFADEESAEAAIEHLRDEVGNYDAGDLAVDGLDVAAGPFWNDDNDFESFVKRAWDEHGMLRRNEGGVYAEVAVGVETDLAEAGVEAEVRISVYDTDTTHLATELARAGMLVVGTVRGHAESSSGTGGSVSAEGSFAVDAYTDSDGDEYVTLTVTGSASTGVVSEMVDYAGVDADVQVEGGGQVSVTVTVPLTADNVSGVVTSLASGHVPSGLAELYDAADITVIVDVTADVTTEVEVDAVVAEGSVTHTETYTENVVTLHKYPDGEFYSQGELDETVETEQWNQAFEPDAPVPYDPDALLYDENGTAIAVASGDTYVRLDDETTPAPEPAVTSDPPTVLERLGVVAEPPAVALDPDIPVMTDPDPDYLYNVDGEPVAIDAGTLILPLPDDHPDAA